jgi:hypothetical protein
MYRFIWTGTNGARHRLVAAEVLAEKFQQLGVKYPSSRLVAISHSHGGNVVAWASTGIEHPISAAIYLNTPFIQVLGLSDNEPSPSLALRVFIGAASMVTLLLYSFFSDWLPTNPDPLVGLIIFVTAFGPMILVQIFLPIPIIKISGKLSKVSNGVRKISRELVVFVVGDEPAAAFNGIYFIQWLGRRIPLAIFISLGVIFACIALSMASPKFNLNPIWKLGDTLLHWCVVVYFASLLLATSAYGLVQGLVALQSSVTVTPAPIGQTNFATVGWTSRDKLRHSLIYESPDAIKRITNWLRSALAEGADQGCDRSEGEML